MRDPTLNILGSFLIAWASYIGAEMLAASGVLSTVTCGLVMGWRQHTTLTAVTRRQARVVWGVLVFVLEAMVFILIGLSLRSVLNRLGLQAAHLGTSSSDSPSSLLPAIGAIVATVVLPRFAWILPATYLPYWTIPALRHHGSAPPVTVPLVMSWAGMRGVVSLAAALALSEQFPGRDLILVTTFAVILVTVIVQGATLAPLILALNVGKLAGANTLTMTISAARAHMAAAQLAAVEVSSAMPDGTQRHPRLLEQYGYRARAAAQFSQAADTLLEDRIEHFNVVLNAINAGRLALLQLHKTGQIHDSVLQALEEELDLDEIRARQAIAASL